MPRTIEARAEDHGGGPGHAELLALGGLASAHHVHPEVVRERGRAGQGQAGHHREDGGEGHRGDEAQEAGPAHRLGQQGCRHVPALVDRP